MFPRKVQRNDENERDCLRNIVSDQLRSFRAPIAWDSLALCSAKIQESCQRYHRCQRNAVCAAYCQKGRQNKPKKSFAVFLGTFL
uniref:Uncharacterized protein n=1 Tax=Romanomermis culicivorax TaxID=13658 RepID=A0A915IGT8_ROMCU